MMDALFEDIRNWCSKHDCTVSFRCNEHGEIEIKVTSGCLCKTDIIKANEHPDESVLRFLVSRLIDKVDNMSPTTKYL